MERREECFSSLFLLLPHFWADVARVRQGGCFLGFAEDASTQQLHIDFLCTIVSGPSFFYSAGSDELGDMLFRAIFLRQA
jgi:hypothetical protein